MATRDAIVLSRKLNVCHVRTFVSSALINPQLVPPDGPAVVRINLYVRSIAKIDDVVMVSKILQPTTKKKQLFSNLYASECQLK
jgi:hypothetical protein